MVAELLIKPLPRFAFESLVQQPEMKNKLEANDKYSREGVGNFNV